MPDDERQKTHRFDGKLQRLFQAFFSDWLFSKRLTEQEMMDRYFTPDFSACIDGIELTSEDFSRRIARMRRETIVEKQEFVEMMETGNKLFSMHTTAGMSLASGKPFETLAIALFVFQGDRIQRGILNSITKGDPEDADMASRA